MQRFLCEHPYPLVMQNSTAPTLYFLVPLICGLLVAEIFTVSLFIMLPILAILVIGALRYKNTTLISGIFFLFGFCLYTFHTRDNQLFKDSNHALYTLRIIDNRLSKIIAYKNDNKEWQRCNVDVVFKHDNNRIYSPEDVIVCEALFTPYPIGQSIYSRNMLEQGVLGEVTQLKLIKARSIDKLEVKPSLSNRLSRWAIDIFNRLELKGHSQSICSAISLAQTEGLDNNLRNSYARSGTLHLLALSGLHLGIVVLLVNFLLRGLVLLPNGNIICSIAAILIIWLFTCMTGFNHSIVRAALMFSILQLSVTFSRRYNSLNTLSFTALIMLVLDPMALHSLSFQLSFISVAAILLWAIPIYHRLKCDWWIWNMIMGSILFGVATTIATAPLILHTFGTISLIGAIATLPLLFTTTTIILGSLLWLLIPLDVLKPVFYYILDASATAQNYIVSLSASWHYSTIDYNISNATMLIIYLIYIILTTLLHIRNNIS